MSAEADDGVSIARAASQPDQTGQQTRSSPVTSVSTCLYVNQAIAVSAWHPPSSAP